MALDENSRLGQVHLSVLYFVTSFKITFREVTLPEDSTTCCDMHIIICRCSVGNIIVAACRYGSDLLDTALRLHTIADYGFVGLLGELHGMD